MSEDCDTSSDNGHKFCSIPYTGTYNANEYIRPYNGGACTGCTDPSCYDDPKLCGKFNDTYGKITRLFNRDNLKLGYSKFEAYIHYGVAPITYTKKKEGELINQSALFPTNDELKDTPNTLILGIEFNCDDIYIGRMSGLYYCDSKNITKPKEWKGYNEGAGNISIFEYYRQDIHNDGNDYKGYRNSKGQRMLLRGSSKDSVVCGIWYKLMNGSDNRYPLPISKGDKLTDSSELYFPNAPCLAVCVAFRRFTNLNSSTEYVYLEQGQVTTSSSRPNSDWPGGECNRGEFISQLEFYYTDFDKKSMEGPAQALGVTIANVTVYPIGVGFKGFSMFRSVNYNVKGGLYDWINDVDKFRCCNLLTNEQYEDDTVEKFICREDFNRKVENSFPTNFPNDVCVSVLQDHCNSKFVNDYSEEEYNVESELCKAACALNETNCDKGIKGYCTSKKFINSRTPEDVKKEIDELKEKKTELQTKLDSSTIRSEQDRLNTDIKSIDKELKDKDDELESLTNNPKTTYNLNNYLKDDICGCMYSSVAGKDVLDSVPLSLSKVLDQTLLDKNDFTLREECSMSTCAKTTFKMFDMKQNILKKPCSSKELCLGKGYMIPSFKNNTSVNCVQYANSDECLEPLTPNITVIPDPFNNGCKNILKKQMNMPKLQPTECKLSDDWTPHSWDDNVRCEKHIDPEDGVEKLMLKQVRQITSPSIPNVPLGDNPLCPPKCGENNPLCDYPLKPDDKIPIEQWIACPYSEPEENDSPPSPSKVKIGITIFIFAILLALIFSLFIKIIKK